MSKKKKSKSKDAPAGDPQVESTAQQQQPSTTETQEQTAAAEGNEPTVAELKQRLQRLGADYHNYQKRTEKQLEQVTQFTKENLVKSLLPVLDNFMLTLEKGAEAQDILTVLQGTQIIYDQLVKTLESVGVQQIKIQAGCAFDPSLHEAILHEENDQHPENTIVRELAGGYVMNGRTVRPAKVAVAKAPQQNTCDDNENQQQDNDSTEDQEKK